MPKLAHPTFDGATVTVAADAVADWVAQGWILLDPPPAPQAPVEAPTQTPRVRTTR